MSVEHYSVTGWCCWRGCSNPALPNPEMPLAPKFCADHVDQGVKAILAETQRINVTVEHRQAVLDAPTLPLAHKPGRWVPWVLFAIWLGLTAIFPVMLLWWIIFVPIAIIGWHFGTASNGNNARR